LSYKLYYRDGNSIHPPRDHPVCDRMVFGFITAYAISAYHH